MEPEGSPNCVLSNCFSPPFAQIMTKIGVGLNKQNMIVMKKKSLSDYPSWNITFSISEDIIPFRVMCHHGHNLFSKKRDVLRAYRSTRFHCANNQSILIGCFLFLTWVKLAEIASDRFSCGTAVIYMKWKYFLKAIPDLCDEKSLIGYRLRWQQKHSAAASLWTSNMYHKSLIPWSSGNCLL